MAHADFYDGHETLNETSDRANFFAKFSRFFPGEAGKAKVLLVRSPRGSGGLDVKNDLFGSSVPSRNLIFKRTWNVIDLGLAGSLKMSSKMSLTQHSVGADTRMHGMELRTVRPAFRRSLRHKL